VPGSTSEEDEEGEEG
jgi:microfibrillar-associated protein 1